MTRTPALLGGTPLRTEPLPVYNTIGAAEKAAVMDVLDRGELSGFVAVPGEYFHGGPWVRKLEAAFKAHYGVKHAVAVNSATSGLHCAVAAMGIGPGDEVIVPPYTMSATATVILMCGAVPIFVDIEDETFCLDPDAVEAAITPRTRGIMAVNLFGHAAALDPLMTIADRHGLFVIEDNAQAPDATYHGRQTGTIGHAGVFSLNRHKTMQSGEGGVVLTDDDTVALKAQLFRNHGEVVVEAMGIEDIVNTAGLNYRMTELVAAVAYHQFAKLPELNAQRVALAQRLSAGLATIDGIVPPVTKSGCTHVYYVYAMKFDEAAVGLSRSVFVDAIRAEGFQLTPGYVKPLYLEPMYQRKICLGAHGFPFTANPCNDALSYRAGLCPTTERLQNSDLMLTNIVYAPLTQADMDLFVEACSSVIASRDAINSATS